MRNPILLALPVVLALAFFLGRLSAPEAAPSGESTSQTFATRASDSDESPAETLEPVNAAREAPESRPSGGEAPPDRDAQSRAALIDSLFSDSLLEHARDGFERGWSFAREDSPDESRIEAGVEAFREGVLELPVAIGLEAARELNTQEELAADARLGGTFALLERLDSKRAGPVFDVVLDQKTFDGLFERSSTPSVRDGLTALRSDDPIEDGATLDVPSGVYVLGDLGRKLGVDFPTDLTIRGAGRESTLIVVSSDWSTYARVRNLTLERCTVHANNNYLFDVRTEPMSVTVRRARLIGWTSGAGSSCLFGTEELALRVEDSEIDGSFCRSMRSGQIFDVRTNGLVARFDRCRIRATRPFRYVRDGATLAFVNCTFEEILSSPKEVPANVRVQGGAVQWFQGDDPEILKRDVNELFPDWAERVERLF
ncbi:MAG: hypothetical protein AAFU73_07275 [Planctomycetota bacterium]